MMRINRQIIFISVILAMLIYSSSGFSQAPQPKLSVDEDIDTPSLSLTPSGTMPAVSGANEGKIYYNSNNQNIYLSRSGATWVSVVQERNIATVIVAAFDSLGTIDSGVGATPRYNNPRADYTCQGTDDQNTIRTAIEACPDYSPATHRGGGAVYLLEGTYDISAPIYLNVFSSNDSGKAIIGAGRGTVLKVASGFDGGVIRAQGAANSNLTNILISTLKVDGDNIVLGATVKGIVFTYVTDSRINNVWIENIEESGIGLYNSSNIIVSGNSISGGDQAIELVESVNNIISANILDTSAFPIVVDNRADYTQGYNTVTNNIITGSTSTYKGIYIIMSSGNIISGNVLSLEWGSSGIELEGVYTAPTNIRPCKSNVIFGNTISYPSGLSSIGGGNGIDLANMATSQNLISANTIKNCQDIGISVGDTETRNNLISGNIIYEPRRAGISISARGGFETTTANNMVSGNFCYQSTTNYSSPMGIGIAGYDQYLVGNYIGGASFLNREIVDIGTGTKYTGKNKITLQPPTYTPLNNGRILDDRIEDPSPPVTSYVRLGGHTENISLSTTVAINDGKSAGDILIVENTSDTYTVTVPDNANTRLTSTHVLTQYDTLELIWSFSDDEDATNDNWVELSYTDYTSP